MVQIAQSGLAVDQQVNFEPGLLSARGQGRFELADSFCRGCEVLDYTAEIRHGLGAWLAGKAAWASADYALSWPQLPITPPLPALQVNAAQRFVDGLRPALHAQLEMPASAHEFNTQKFNTREHQYGLSQQGLSGQIKPGYLQLNSPALEVQRDAHAWLGLQGISLEAAAAENLLLSSQVESLTIPAWQWQGKALALNYQQHGNSQKLDINLDATLQNGQLQNQPPHGEVRSSVKIERLNVVSTQAFASELPRLLSPQLTGAARMIGLFSLYSVHGPGFFAEHPALHWQAQKVPLIHGFADINIKLAVTPETRRPPMHPVEWQRALQGRVEITAPSQHLAAWWNWASMFVNYVTGLPRDYASLKQQGWVTPQADGRDKLLFVLDPAVGVRH